MVALKDSDAAERDLAGRPARRQDRRPDRHHQPRRGRRGDRTRASEPQVFNNSNDVVTALKNEQVDAVVVDLPTALYLTAVQVPDATVVGQFSAPGGDQWGALLDKGLAADRLRLEGDRRRCEASGELAEINQRWMSQAAGAPELQLSRAQARRRPRPSQNRAG